MGRERDTLETERDPDVEATLVSAPGTDPLLSAHDPLPGLGTLVAIVAHEIHNPITYVLAGLNALRELLGPLGHTLESYRSLVRRELGESGEAAIASTEAKLEEAGGIDDLVDLVADTLEGADRIRGLVRDLLTLSRSAGASTGPIDPNEVIAATVRLVSRRVRARAQLEQDLSATRWVDGNAARLGQVFLNLLTNAIDACEPPDPARHRIAVRTRDTASGVRIEIHDTGGGVPSGAGRRIFDPYYTRKGAGKGTGLGLYLCRRIVEDHGGTIGYRRRPGGGTVFIVVLPAQGQ
jgi:signal transduction histidine kinase